MKTFCLFLFICMLSAAGVSKAQSASELSRQVNNLRLSQRESEKLTMEQLKRVKAILSQIQENNAALVTNMTILQRKMVELEKSNSLLKEEVKSLKAMLASETKARTESMNKFAGEVARQTASLKSAAKTKPEKKKPASPQVNSTLPVGEGEFYEHIVEKGSTLSAIAKAYKVKVKDIKKANRLKSNTIRIGQKLYIPKM